MADELELLTINANGDGWVDSIPGAVSTGFGAQNTNIEARGNGQDSSVVSWNSGASKLELLISGVIDVDGLPFVVKSLTQFTLGAVGTYYIKLVAGSTTTKRTPSLVTTAGTYDPSKNGFYVSGERVLDWVIKWAGSGTPSIYRRLAVPTDTGLILKNFIAQSGTCGIDVSDLKKWDSDYVALEMSLGSFFVQRTGGVIFLAQNAYFDGAWKYKTSAAASYFRISYNSGMIFYTAPAGVADAVITWTQNFKVDNAGIITANALNIGGGNLKQKLVNIGDWNMQTTTSVTVATGVIWSDVVSITVIIRDNTDDFRYDLYKFSNANDPNLLAAGIAELSSTNVILTRRAGGFFAAVSFNSTAYNRGFILITYK